VIPAFADTRFQAHRMTRNDVPLGKGQCDIRLQVDNEVEVSVRGDMVYARTLSGRDARDDGSECNAPLPSRDLQNFNFEVLDKRGDIQLLSEPSPRNGYQAIVRIRDSESGEGRYHFRLSWAMTGEGMPGRRDGNGFPGQAPGPQTDNGRFPDGRFGDRPGDRGAPGFSWNNTIDFRGRGTGSAQTTGFGTQRLADVVVNVDRGGRILVNFRSDAGRPLTFSGTVIGSDRNRIRADVSSDAGRVRLRGTMNLNVDNRNEVESISLDATDGRDRMNLNWQRR
jgi:hypothetical protein